MLTFTIRLQIDGPMGCEEEEKDVDWHVGERPSSDYEESADLQVLSAYADGHELEYIETYFRNLPIMKRNERSCIWRGEMARFIWDNLDKQLPPSLKR